jgi:hypothetical protein
MYNRLHSYKLQQPEHLQEERAIHNILYNNGFPIQPHKPHQPKPKRQNTQTQTQKLATFTYIGKESTYIINILKNTNIKIASRTNNTIYNHLTQKHYVTDKYAQSGVYKLACLECKKAYVGQTGKASCYDITNTNNHSRETATPQASRNTS